MTTADDPSVVRAIAVSETDLVATLESRTRGAEERTVLRVTPPFSGRMRARIHVERGGPASDPSPISIEPERLVTAACPEPPRPDGVADAIREDESVDYTVDRHRECYGEALRQWRERVPEFVVESVSLPGGSDDVTVTVLGDVDP